MKYLIPFLLVGGAAYLISQPTPRETVGLQRDGSVLLNSGWRLRPAGRQIPLDTFPMSTAMTPDGRFLLVLNGGYRPPSVMVLDANTLVEVSRIGVPDGWLGLAVSSNGRNVYVGGGSRASVFELALSHEGQLSMSRTFAVVPEPERKHTDFTGDVALSPDGRMLYAAQLYRDEIAVINPLSGIVIERFPTGRRPYRILFPPDGKSLFVSSWVDAAVYQHRPETGERMGLTRVGPHPTDMIWRAKQPNAEESEGGEWAARIFVAAANTNSLYVIGVNEDRSTRVVETINVAMSPRQPLGMTPSALALSPDLSRLYAVCSDANAVAAIEVSGAKSRMLGFIPSGWYPTAARVLADGRVFIANGRGSRTFANPNGPQPGVAPAISHEGIRNPGYVGNLQVGTASVVDAPSEAQIRTYTETVQELSPYNDYLLAQTRAYNAIVPASPDGSAKSPIEHVIYIVKENRTYDQVFGDLGLGNGDPSLVLFREDSTPNHRKLAREFVLLDNFYVNADVSADGHSWSSAAIAPDYVQKLWPNSYAARRKHYDYEGQELAALPPAGYLWTNALSKGLTLRNYGWWVENKPTPGGPGEVQVQSVRDPALRASTSMAFRGFSLDYPDVDRAKVFISELAEFERADKMPRLTLIRIGNDHTSGTSPGKIAPLSAMADNDLALGMIVEAVSRSKFWLKTAIFVLEDDAQNGPDHVDSHRSPAFVISPYTRSRGIDSTMYNTASMLRTMELILGLRPMTHFDAAARPMASVFRLDAQTGPYAAVRPIYPLDQRNPGNAPGAAKSAKMDFDEADEVDDDELNEILWRAIRKTEPPAPTRSIFGR